MKLNTNSKAVILLQLLALAYLGFYVWGLAMSVFTPGELGVLSIVAGLLVIGLAFSVLLARETRTQKDREELQRTNAQLRETRGF